MKVDVTIKLYPKYYNLGGWVWLRSEFEKIVRLFSGLGLKDAELVVDSILGDTDPFQIKPKEGKLRLTSDQFSKMVAVLHNLQDYNVDKDVGTCFSWHKVILVDKLPYDVQDLSMAESIWR